MSLGLKLTCTNGHTQTIRTEGMSREWIEQWGKLMDGTSDFYVRPVMDGEATWIGHCRTCAARVKSEVVEVECGDQVARTSPDGLTTTIAHEIPAVDRSSQQLVSGEPVPADRSHVELKPNGQQKDYVVLSPEERAKGWVRPLRKSYVHLPCGTVTTMGDAIAETYARDPKFYSGTFCCRCSKHYPLDQFVWEGTAEMVGS